MVVLLGARSSQSRWYTFVTHKRLSLELGRLEPCNNHNLTPTTLPPLICSTPTYHMSAASVPIIMLVKPDVLVPLLI